MEEPGGEGKDVAVGVVEAWEEGHAFAVDLFRRRRCEGTEVLEGAYGLDAAIFYGDGGREGLGGFQSLDPGVKEKQVCIGIHVGDSNRLVRTSGAGGCFYEEFDGVPDEHLGGEAEFA